MTNEEQDGAREAVNVWCHACQGLVEVRALVYLDERKRKSIHVTPAVLAEHRATHAAVAS